jgi:pyruvoyl-dependent arginine decarboxylase
MKTKSTTGKGREIATANPLVPRKVFITRGVGVHQKQLTSRELAMTDAGVEKMNMIKASSIIPPGCEFVSVREGKEQLMIGQMTFAILAEAQTNEPYKRISAAIGIARPDDPSEYGFFTEIEEDQGGIYSLTRAAAQRTLPSSEALTVPTQPGIRRLACADLSKSLRRFRHLA